MPKESIKLFKPLSEVADPEHPKTKRWKDKHVVAVHDDPQMGKKAHKPSTKKDVSRKADYKDNDDERIYESFIWNDEDKIKKVNGYIKTTKNKIGRNVHHFKNGQKVYFTKSGPDYIFVIIEPNKEQYIIKSFSELKRYFKE